MNYYDVVYKLAREQGISIENLCLKLGKAPRYIAGSKSRGSLPKINNANMILNELGYTICIMPNEDIPEDAIIID